VSVSFGGVHAVRDVSLEIPPGQVLGLIGPNGAGKTTLFNALSGVVRASGSVVLGDTDLSRSPVRRRALAGLGRTFQNLSLHEGLTTLDHVLIGRHRFYRYNLLSESLRLPGVIRSERQGRSEAMALLELVGLAEVADVRVDDRRAAVAEGHAVDD
jgi:ABC-type branched-subunit amino acid transport system ATPase component